MTKPDTMTRVDLGPAAADTDDVRFVADWIPADQRAGLLAALLATLPLREETVFVHGKHHPMPRRTCWHAPSGCVYRYSGLAMEPHALTPELARQQQLLQDLLGEPLNCVLANHYRDGRDSVGWHADDEPVFGPTPTIASVSLGATRRFLLKHKPTGDKVELELTDGSLLVMRGTTQANWLHTVPKTRKPVGERLNLTWRHFHSAGS